MKYTLQPANPESLQIVLTWIETPEQLKLWGGSALTFPPMLDQTWQEIGATSQNTFSLNDTEGSLVGFGQTLFREPGKVHLGRIIISPAVRGKGIGRILCQKLIQAGSTHCQPSEFTLNVYRDNTPAFNLYTSLGFTVLSEDPEQGMFKMCLRVTAAAEG